MNLASVKAAFAVVALLVSTVYAPGAEGDPPDHKTYSISVVNKTAGRWEDRDIWVLIIGQADPGRWRYLTPDGTARQINHTEKLGPGHLTKGGRTFAPMSYRLPSSGNLLIPGEFQGARVYISLGSPLFVDVFDDDMGLALPDAGNLADPNHDVYWDHYEFTFVDGRVPFGGNTTQVDQFGFPLTVRVTQDATGFDQLNGIQASRRDIFEHFRNNEDEATFGKLLDGDYRILAPRSSAAFANDEPASVAMSHYIDKVWNSYRQGFRLERLDRTFSGAVQADGRLHIAYEGEGDYVVSKPSERDVWACSGALSTGSVLELEIGAELCAAFNRGVAEFPALWWGSPGSYYPVAGTRNNYADYFHAVSISSLAYAFPYDDVNAQSSVAILPNFRPPSTVTLTIGW